MVRGTSVCSAAGGRRAAYRRDMGVWQVVVIAVMSLVTAVTPAERPAPPPQDAAQTSADSQIRRFWVKDEHRYASPWYAGAHRKRVNFGCTRAPYYNPHPSCRRGRGFHHGLDIAMPCGTRLFAGFRGRVVAPGSSGALGSAYGQKAFRIRNFRKDVDVVIGHVRRVYVEPGDRIRRGRLIARAGKLGAPDGCHLHFEVRPIGGGYTTAIKPHGYIRLHR